MAQQKLKACCKEEEIFVFFVSFVRTLLDDEMSQGFTEDFSQSSQRTQPDGSPPKPLL
jgi:hypothetical protein